MTPTDLASPAAPAAYRRAFEDAAPLGSHELRALALRPHRVIDLVLVERTRLAQTIAAGRSLPSLIAILLVTSVLSALPYGIVLGPRYVLRVAALNVGSVAICFPALHIWSAAVGSRNRLQQDLGLALVVSAVAGAFGLGFAPIVWFLRLTTSEGAIGVGAVSAALLAVSVLAGVVHLARTLGERSAALAPGRGHRVIMVAWAGLLLFIAHRMGDALGLG